MAENDIVNLNEKQRIFVVAFSKNNDVEFAAKEADYSLRRAKDLLKMPKIIAAIDLQNKINAQSCGWTHLDILQRIKLVVERSLQETPSKNGKLFKFDGKTALQGLELYGKFHGMWQEHFKHSLVHDDTHPAVITEKQIKKDLKMIYNRGIEESSDVIDLEKLNEQLEEQEEENNQQ